MKRVMDMGIALMALVLLAPFLFLIALVLILVQGRPVFFSQKRPGKDSKPFYLYKFRTMRPPRAESMNREDLREDKDLQRITRIGKVLRSTSLDELPSLWNVIKGDMSLVGPRPLLMEYLPLYNSRQARRHEVRPGITGWAQIHGRNCLSWEDQFDKDLWYVENQSFSLDLKILWRTLVMVLQRKDIEDGSEYTREPFQPKSRS